MKKTGIVSIAVGAVIAAASTVLKLMENRSVSIIGGADGPTSVFVAGKLGSGSEYTEYVGVAAGILLVIAGAVMLCKANVKNDEKR